MLEFSDWRKNHGETISLFLTYLNQNSKDYVLKGGTALMTCYHLDRFSEDIDLDGKGDAIENIVSDFCTKQKFTFRIAKNTNTVKRYMVNYGNLGKPLKIEISYRKIEIPENETTYINNVKVYRIEQLGLMKAMAYSARDKLRDLYDLTFICNKFWDELSETVKSVIRTSVDYKGIEQFDNLTRDQSDDLIDPDRLADNFMEMYDKLGLLYAEEELSPKIKSKNDFER